MAEYRPATRRTALRQADPRNGAALDVLFAALSDRTRRDMLSRLVDGEHSVGELAAPFAMSLAAASKHIKVLEVAGLVRREIHGRTHRVHLDAQPLHAGVEWLRHYEQFWSRSLDALAILLEDEDRAARATPAAARKRRTSK